MEAGILFITILYFLLSTVALLSNIFGIPGNALIFVFTLGYKLIAGSEIMGWITVIIVFVLFLLGEVLESALGLRGARKAGLSRKAMIASFVGAIAGSILMAPFLLGLGAIIGAVMGAFLGAFLTALLEERKLQKALEGGVESAKGRLLGTAVKGAMGLLMIAVSAVAVIK